jgi:hypothetical protein
MVAAQQMIIAKMPNTLTIGYIVQIQHSLSK